MLTLFGKAPAIARSLASASLRPITGHANHFSREYCLHLRRQRVNNMAFVLMTTLL